MLRGLSPRSITALWTAMNARYAAQNAAAAEAYSGRRTISTRSAGGSRPPVETTRTPDGRVSKTYNLFSFAMSQPASDKPLR